jgi:hypothetical protein
MQLEDFDEVATRAQLVGRSPEFALGHASGAEASAFVADTLGGSSSRASPRRVVAGAAAADGRGC